MKNNLSIENAEKIEHHILDCSKEPLPFNDGSVDVVLLTEVIEHLENPFDALREIHRILKPETGILICTYPNTGNLNRRIAFLFSGDNLLVTDKNDHVNNITDMTFRKMIDNTFEHYWIEDISYHRRGRLLADRKLWVVSK